MPRMYIIRKTLRVYVSNINYYNTLKICVAEIIS